MRTIKLYDAILDIRTLYRKANTQSQRALVGYITKAGLTQDPIFGGAFRFLCDVERCMDNGEIYELYSLVDSDTKAKIKHIAQMALNGEFDKFTMKKSEMETILKAMSEI